MSSSSSNMETRTRVICYLPTSFQHEEDNKRQIQLQLAFLHALDYIETLYRKKVMDVAGYTMSKDNSYAGRWRSSDNTLEEDKKWVQDDLRIVTINFRLSIDDNVFRNELIMLREAVAKAYYNQSQLQDELWIIAHELIRPTHTEYEIEELRKKAEVKKQADDQKNAGAS